MRKAQTEYQDKYWNYQEGYNVNEDPYEAIVQSTIQPYDFSASRIHEEKKKKSKKMNKRTRLSEYKKKAKDVRINGDQCFVSSFSKKIEIQPKVIVHHTGFIPEPAPSEGVDDTKFE